MTEIHPRRLGAIRSAQIPPRFEGRRLSALKVDTTVVLPILTGWLDDLEQGMILPPESAGQESCGVGLLLYGSPGHGKTTLACALLQEIALTSSDRRLTEYRSLFYIRYPDLIALMKKEMDGDEDAIALLDAICARKPTATRPGPTRVLVLDDLGKEYKTEWSETIVDHVLRRRYDLGLPTIVTTNVEPGEWAALYGEATASFASEAFLSLHILNPSGDRRQR